MVPIRLNVAKTQEAINERRALGFMAWLEEFLGDFIELCSSVETSLALWSYSPGWNPIYFGMHLVEESILVFAIHEEYVLLIYLKFLL